MAKPRVFVSSTYYDLKHIRASLDIFIESLGFESVLSEKGDIAYTHDRALDESCYREAQNADLFVLIIGGRYGSGASTESKKPARSFFERYDSITKKEYESAVNRDIPIYILVEAGVYTEYQTFLRNKGNENIQFAHVDSANIFHLIEEILARPRNSPVKSFERFAEIESWLRDQWAGTFRELLNKQSQQQQLVALTTEVGQLKEINETLKKYLEAVMTGATTAVSEKLIQSEEKRLEEIKTHDAIRANDWFKFVSAKSSTSVEEFVSIITTAPSFDDFVDSLFEHGNPDKDYVLETLREHRLAREDYNQLRKILNLPEVNFKTAEKVFKSSVTKKIKDSKRRLSSNEN